MLQYRRQNVHRSKLPPGAVEHIVGLSTVDHRRKCLVSHYTLTDSTDYRFSIGIDTLFVRFLDNGEIARFSGYRFEALP